MRTQGRLGLLAGALALVTAALVWATVRGPALVTSGPPPTAQPEREVQDPRSLPASAVGSPPATPVRPQGGGGWDGLPAWLPWLLVAAMLVLAVVVARTVVRRLRALPRDDREDSSLGPDLVPEPVLDEEAARQQRVALAGGTPRNGIVACWVELERLAAAAGSSRREAETSAEFTRRVLAEQHVPEDAIAALAEAYREARFSSHEVDEELRSSAGMALDRLHDALLARGTATSTAATAPSTAAARDEERP
ncbi:MULTISPECIES: DUF4129 domain-containing protein [Arsenicicoccus]|uniref:DUF4129 domain-containing protein n=1 Tax=Arsenicicoccus TaxID=267408 RepID=UPI00257A9F1B|nr:MULTISPECIES: DUF4129 domain-containing protein [Arsenicicoccus]